MIWFYSLFPYPFPTMCSWLFLIIVHPLCMPGYSIFSVSLLFWIPVPSACVLCPCGCYYRLFPVAIIQTTTGRSGRWDWLQIVTRWSPSCHWSSHLVYLILWRIFICLFINHVCVLFLRSTCRNPLCPSSCHQTEYREKERTAHDMQILWNLNHVCRMHIVHNVIAQVDLINDL